MSSIHNSKHLFTNIFYFGWQSISSHRIENRRLFNGRVFIHSYERQNIELFDGTPEDARRRPG